MVVLVEQSVRWSGRQDSKFLTKIMTFDLDIWHLSSWFILTLGLT